MWYSSHPAWFEHANMVNRVSLEVPGPFVQHEAAGWVAGADTHMWYRC